MSNKVLEMLRGKFHRFIQRRRLGFDSSNVWDLDHEMMSLLYARLQLFHKDASAVVDMSHTIETSFGEMTLDDAVLLLIDMLKTVLVDDTYDDRDKLQNDIWTLWCDIHMYMWW